MSVKDTRLKARAIMEQWDVPEEYQQPLIREMVRIVLSPTSSNREKTAAYKALTATSKKDEPRYAATEPEGNRFLEIAERLGIDTGITGVIEARPVRGDEATDNRPARGDESNRA